MKVQRLPGYLFAFVAPLLLSGCTRATSQEPAAAGAPLRTVDLRPLWDTDTVLENPDKGWFHHLYDNTPANYAVASDAELDDFPGLNHLFVRLAWSFFEPRDDVYDWHLIDTLVSRYVSRGYKLSLAVTTKETSPDGTPDGSGYATPKWVVDAGARGSWVDNWGVKNWEPDYGDPLFLEKLSEFHAALARRYDGKPWLVDVVTGSYGDWGEGHTGFSSNTVPEVEVLEAHIDLYTRNYRRTPVVIGDEYVKWGRSDAEASRLRAYAESRGLSYRDDSVLVDWYVDTFSDTFSVESPALFGAVWRERPTTLEAQHYGLQKEAGTWLGPNGDDPLPGHEPLTGAAILEGAVRTAHATYVGYHGYAREWLTENPELARRLANLIGYWYFPRQLSLPTAARRGQPFTFRATWENHGVAPAYRPYGLYLKLEPTSGGAVYTQRLASDNLRWLPGEARSERYQVALPETLAPGEYRLKLGLFDLADPQKRPVRLGLKAALLGKDGFYRVARVRVD